MAAKASLSNPPRIANRRALHDYFISAKLECGLVLVGTEVKALRQGRAQLQDSYVSVEAGRLILFNCHIDPYDKASTAANHIPRRERVLLAHKREIRKLEQAAEERGVTLVPLAIYFKDGRAKIEVGVAKGKKQHDKRETIKQKEVEREIRRAMSR